MPTKLKIKMGHIEFEYEGDAAYDNEAVKDLFTHMESLMVSAPPGAFDNPNLAPNGVAPDSDGDTTPDTINLSIQSVCAHMKAKSGSEVAIAAATHLQLCEGRKSFNRKELLSDMQNASGYYNQVMSSNLTRILKGLIGSKRIMALNGEQMALSSSELASAKAQLAQS